MNIASILRHWFTLAATLLTGWLVLPAEQQAELSKALGDLVGPLVIIITLVVTAGWRVALAWISKLFRMGSGEIGEKKNGGSSGGVSLLIVLCCTAVALAGLPSCSLPPGFPIKATVQLEEGALSYSSKGGLEMEYRPGYGQMPDHYRKAPIVDRRSAK